jgi:hypothetical protein
MNSQKCIPTQIIQTNIIQWGIKIGNYVGFSTCSTLHDITSMLLTQNVLFYVIYITIDGVQIFFS